MKKLLTLVLLSLGLFMVVQAQYPDKHFFNNLIVYGKMEVKGDSLSVTLVSVDSIRIAGQVIRYASGDSLAGLEWVRQQVSEAGSKVTRGLIFEDDSIKIGGSINENADIDVTSGNRIYFKGQGDKRFRKETATPGKYAQLVIIDPAEGDVGFVMQVSDGLGNGKFITLTDANTQGIKITENITNKGLHYDADYSVVGLTDPLWIPDLATVKKVVKDSIDPINQSQWIDTINGIYYANNVIIGDTTYILGDVQHTPDTIDQELNQKVNKHYTEYNLRPSAENTFITGSSLNESRIRILNNGIKAGKASYFDNVRYIENYNDSVGYNIGGLSYFMDNYQGFINIMEAGTYFSATNPTANRSKTVTQNGISVTSNVKPGSGGLAIVDNLNGLKINVGMGRRGISTITNAKGIDIIPSITALSGHSVNIAEFIGLNLDLTEGNISGSVSLGDLYGLRLVKSATTNPTGLHYGIYENFGANYFGSHTTIDDSVRITDTARFEKPIYIGSNLVDGTSGTTYTFSNGITELGGGVKIGGPIIENTQFDIFDDSHFFKINGDNVNYTTHFTVATSAILANTTMDALGWYSSMSMSGAGFTIENSDGVNAVNINLSQSGITINDDVANVGLLGGKDFSTNYTANSYIQKGWADLTYMSSISGNNNELLISNGAGGIKTDPSLSWDGNTLNLEMGNDNVFIGTEAGSVNTTTGVYNTAVGVRSGYSLASAHNNVLIGRNSGYSLNSGDGNVYLGNYAGNSGDGSRNVYIGYQSGNTNGSGSGNIFIGYQANTSTEQSNKLVFGNDLHTLVEGDFATKNIKFNDTLSTKVVKSLYAKIDTIYNTHRTVKIEITPNDTIPSVVMPLNENVLITGLHWYVKEAFNGSSADTVSVYKSDFEYENHTSLSAFLQGDQNGDWTIPGYNYITASDTLKFRYAKGPVDDATQGKIWVMMHYIIFKD